VRYRGEGDSDRDRTLSWGKGDQSSSDLTGLSHVANCCTGGACAGDPPFVIDLAAGQGLLKMSLLFLAYVREVSRGIDSGGGLHLANMR
jgi:hypothetical protein